VIVHLYTFCFNDEHMLAFFFKHYNDVVDKYFVFDDGSTDQTLDILRKQERVEIRKAPDLSKSDHRILESNIFQNSFWKESVGVADWIFVVDVDEHLFHNDLRSYLVACKENGVTVVPAIGFEMVGENFPPKDHRLCDVLTKGEPSFLYSKPSIFSPNSITNMRFSLGRHGASPEGHIVLPQCDEVLLLHFKHVDFEFLLRRHREFLLRQSITDIKNGHGIHYSSNADQLRKSWDSLVSRSIDVRHQQTIKKNGRKRDYWWYPLEKFRLRNEGSDRFKWRNFVPFIDWF